MANNQFNRNHDYLSELKRNFRNYKTEYNVDNLLTTIGYIGRQINELKQQYHRIPNTFIHNTDPEHQIIKELDEMLPTYDSISSSESSPESSSNSARRIFNPKTKRQQYPYKIIIDTHGCIHRGEIVKIQFPFGSLKYYGKPGEQIICVNTYEEILSIAEGKHRLYPYDITTTNEIIKGEPHIQVDNMTFTIDENNLRNVYLYHDGVMKLLWDDPNKGYSIKDVFNVDGTLKIKTLFSLLVSEISDSHPDINPEDVEIIISSCLSYCGEPVRRKIHTRVRAKTHRYKNKTLKKLTSNSR